MFFSRRKPHDSPCECCGQKLDVALAKLDELRTLVTQFTRKEAIDMAGLADSVAALQQKVTDETNATQAAVTLLNGLSAQIAALKDSVTDPAVIAQIDALAATVDQNAQALAQAVVANTPAQQ